MNRLRRSWELAKASWGVIRSDWTLLRYPLVSGVLSMILGSLALLFLWGSGTFESSSTDDVSIGSMIGLFIFYLVTYTVVIFCNVALVSTVMAKFAGQPEHADTGWAAARARWRKILGWAAIAATVGVLLNVLSNRGDRVTEILAVIGAAAWSLATFLIVPVLVVENVGPVDALKRSTTLLKRTWGEQIAGNAGIGLVTGLLMVGVIAVGGGLIWLAALTSNVVVIVVAVIPVLVAVAITMTVTSAMGTVYSAATYRYATNEPTVGFGASDLLPTAFAAK
ncbi:MAG: DUF6159 family protein [Chloroflexota bacterium]|nr:DUF6159 family protein [Chloroflexota bacterium]